MDFTPLTLSREEAEHMRHMEQLRRKNHNFFKVYFNGDVKRVHCLKDIKIQENVGLDGKKTYTPIEGDRVVDAMEENSSTGRNEAYIYEDPEDFNKFWLSRNADTFDIEIEDERIRRQVESLKNKPFKMAETRKELLTIEKHKIERELRHLDEEEKKIDEEEKRANRGKLKTAEMVTDKIRNEPERLVDKPIISSVKGMS